MSHQVNKSVTESRCIVTETGAPLIPPEIRELLGPPPLTSSEDTAAYERMFVQMALAIDPRDFIEWTWVKELVDLMWEAARAHRAKAVRLALARKAAIYRILQAHRVGRNPSRSRFQEDLWMDADQIYRGEEREMAEFEAALERLGLAKDAVEDAAYFVVLEEVQQLQELADKASARRDALLREIERRRHAVAARARKAADTIDAAVDAEFE